MEVKNNLCRVLLETGRTYFGKFKQPRSYIQCCGSGMLIPDPNFPSEIQVQKGTGYRVRIRNKKFKYF
jgi:hypothetical protein